MNIIKTSWSKKENRGERKKETKLPHRQNKSVYFKENLQIIESLVEDSKLQIYTDKPPLLPQEHSYKPGIRNR